MTTNTMTIHKALSELKIIDDRITKAISAAVFCIANKHSNTKIKGIPLVECQTEMKASYDKASDLIRRRDAIKRAVVLSNAITKVTVGGKDYTVAEAIEMKNHGMTFKALLMETLQNQYNKAQAECLKNNGEDLERRAEQYVVGIYGAKEGKTNTDDFEKAKKDFITSNQFEVVDPIGVKAKIDALEAEIAEFVADVDAALSTSNALTTIEVSY